MVFGKKPSKTPAADMQLPDPKDVEALAKASGVPVEEIVKDAPPAAKAELSKDFEDEEKTDAVAARAVRPREKNEGACPVCGLVTRESTCPIDGSKLKE